MFSPSPLHCGVQLGALLKASPRRRKGFAKDQPEALLSNARVQHLSRKTEMPLLPMAHSRSPAVDKKSKVSGAIKAVQTTPAQRGSERF
jgi:hypothetical protein